VRMTGKMPPGRPMRDEPTRRDLLSLPEGRGARRAPRARPRPKTPEELDEEVRKKRRREGAREAVRRSRERGLRQLQEDPEDPRHGTATGYIYGCRCESCREYWNGMRRAQDTKARERKRTGGGQGQTGTR